MSGHSKWSSIKHKKGAADARRGKLFSKLTRAIIVAAREGGGDPAGNLAGSGSVAWLFDRRGVVLVAADGVDEDELTLAAAEGGADDVELDGSSFEISSAPDALSGVREAVEAAGFAVESVEVALVPKTNVTVEEEADARRILRLIDALEDNDDVQDVYSNFDIPEAVLETAAS